MSQVVEYENVYKGGKSLLVPGKLRIASSGLGFKASSNGKITTVPAQDIRRAQIMRGSRGFLLRIVTANGEIVKFDGFQADFDENGNAVGGQIEEIKRLFKQWRLDVEIKETQVRGWNWGQTDFTGNSLWFNISNKPVMEVPLDQVSGTTLNGKTEVSIEFKLPVQEDLEEAGNEGKRTDQLVEARFYIPNGSTSVEKEGDNDDEMEVDEDSAAVIFYETIKAKADVGQLVGEPIAMLEDLPFITPRGRYNMDMYEDSLRLHGKSHNYKIVYKNIKNVFVLPRPDDVHEYVVLGLDPPLRQGQTRYPYLVMQCVKDVDLEIDLNVDALQNTDGQDPSQFLMEKYNLRTKYDASMHQVVSALISGFSGQEILKPSIFKSHFGNPCLKCSTKANEGYIYFLSNCAIFLPKPTHYFKYEDISQVIFSRMNDDLGGSSRTFDMKVLLRNGANSSIQFSGIEKDEFAGLQSHLKAVGVRVKTEVNAEAQALKAIEDLTSSSDEDDSRPVNINNLEEDYDEEEDGDFQGGSSESEESGSEEDDEGSESEEQNGDEDEE